MICFMCSDVNYNNSRLQITLLRRFPKIDKSCFNNFNIYTYQTSNNFYIYKCVYEYKLFYNDLLLGRYVLTFFRRKKYE